MHIITYYIYILYLSISYIYILYPISISYIYIYIYLSLSISIYIYLYLSISISIYLYLYLSLSISIYLSIYFYGFLSIHGRIEKHNYGESWWFTMDMTIQPLQIYCRYIADISESLSHPYNFHRTTSPARHVFSQLATLASSWRPFQTALLVQTIRPGEVRMDHLPVRQGAWPILESLHKWGFIWLWINTY